VGLLLWDWQAVDCCTAGVTAARWLAANASSATFPAAIGGLTHTCSENWHKEACFVVSLVDHEWIIIIIIFFFNTPGSKDPRG